MATKVTPKKATPKTEAPKKERVVIQYYHDGQPISPYQNKLSSIAYWYTRGIDGKDTVRVSSQRLKELLTKLGVKEPKTTLFDVTLPNGVRISSTLGSLVPLVPRVKKSETPAAQGVRAKNYAQREKAKQRIAETAQVKKWKDGGEVGPKPTTPALDELKAFTGDRMLSKGAQKATQVSKQASVKPTKANGKTIRKAPAKKVAAAAKKAPAKKAAASSKSATVSHFRPVPKPSGAKKAAAS